jgi:tetratricopeptide (TPR) repeat protein/transcriptional regulator with XRE-family HTH domain
VAGQAGLGFGGLLRRLRDDAGLTQDELAEAARVSQRAVSDLERGINRTARKDTAVLLAGALGLDGPARDLFVAAARGRGPAEAVLAARHAAPPGTFAAAATRALPRDTAAFTGREAELARLAGALDGLAANGGVVGIHAIDGMAGIGKTTFAVHAAHRLAGSFPDGQFFLPLHAHTAGQRPVDPADGLASLLTAAGLAAAQIPPGLEARAARWRDQLAGKRILLVLDDAAGHDQVRPLLPGTAGTLVLITSRRRLTALDGATVISLDVLAAGEAAALLARLAGRPGIDAADPAVGELTRLCGHLPLAIGMLASQLRHHPAWTAATLAAGLTAARDRLAMMRAENLSVAAAFGLSYAELTAGQQRAFRRLGLVPGPSFDAHAAAALDDTSLDQARDCLEGLYDQHLLAEPAPGRYQLHDLLREHARALAAADNQADSGAAAERLLEYYLHTALAAAQHHPSAEIMNHRLPPARPPPYAPPVTTRGQAEAWLDAELVSLQAAASYALASGRFRHAMLIPAALAAFLVGQGYWDQGLALHQTALDAARQAGDQTWQARALRQLSAGLFRTDDRAAAAAALRQALELCADLGDQHGEADALNRLGGLHLLAGDYPSAAACHQQAAALWRSLGNPDGQAEAINGLGLVQQETGDYPAAAASQRKALQMYRDLGNRYGQLDALFGLGDVHRLTGDYPAAAATLHQIQELTRDVGDRYSSAFPLHRRGMLHRLTGDYPAAGASISEALEVFRERGDRPAQATALDDLGLVQQLTGDYPAAAASHQQALDLHRELGFRAGEAGTLNSLGELSLRMTATGQARDHHTRALAIARDIGAPLLEARALEGIGTSHLHDGNPGHAAEHLQQALSIYQRIGAPAARRVQETLRHCGPQPAANPPTTRKSPTAGRRRAAPTPPA